MVVVDGSSLDSQEGKVFTSEQVTEVQLREATSVVVKVSEDAVEID